MGFEQAPLTIEKLHRDHGDRIRRYLARLVGTADAEDLAQDVFLKAHRHLDSFRAASRFSTWLYSIVRNESFSRLERMPPLSDSEDVLADIAAADAGPEELADRSQRGQYVRELLTATLDRLERAVFVLHYGEGMPLDAITRLLRLDNTSGAKAYIVSARRKLAKAAQRIRARGDTV